MKGARSNRVTLRGHNHRLMATELRRSIHVVSASKKKPSCYFKKKFSNTTIAIRFNPFKVCPSVSAVCICYDLHFYLFFNLFRHTVNE